MPTYDYYCSSCNHQLEAFQKMTDEKLQTCPHCHKETLVRRPGGGIGLAFQGDGFYATMYGKNKEGKGSASSSSETDKSCPCGKKTTDCQTD